MTFDDLEKLVFSGADPHDILGSDLKTLRQFKAICHPDKHPDQFNRATAVFKRLVELENLAKKPPVVIKGKKHSYTLQSRVAIGDLADIHLAVAAGEPYYIKASRIPNVDGLLAHEYQALTAFQEHAGDTKCHLYFPAPVESIPIKDGFPKRLNVFYKPPGRFFTAEQVLERYPKGLPGHHLVWLFKRILTAVDYAYTCGYIHGAVLPPHILINPDDHGVQLIGWAQSVKIGDVVKMASSRFHDWYPSEIIKKQAPSSSTDIFLAARCMVYLAGGDPLSGQCPSHIQKPIARFLRSCLLDSPRMRPQVALDLYHSFTEEMHKVFGDPRFHVLTM